MNISSCLYVCAALSGMTIIIMGNVSGVGISSIAIGLIIEEWKKQ